MGKHPTPLLRRASPHTLKSPAIVTSRATSSPHRKPALFHRSTIAHALRSPAHRARASSANTGRFLASRSQLTTIQEEPEDEVPEASARRQRAYGDPHGPRRHPAWSPTAIGLDADVDMLSEDDESTLQAMFEDSSSEHDEAEQLMALVDSLKGPMAAQSASLKDYLRRAIMPAYDKVKAVHATIEDKVDLRFGAGLLTFDEVCKKVERIALRDEDGLRSARAESQYNIERTLEELEAAYARRKELWAKLEDDLERCAARASTALEALGADVEQAISHLDKRSKSLDKDSGAAANNKMLRDMLEKL
ncbi:uncharacterized protein BXZ73DRAFT_90559 [Epithele typhae]|uniref:uncharacterized protein n=1 Tax=Epithele typhae TaxID=378194 RepID=UPI00200800BE|nr:uncharacterized protein BXZ73DRAFT_90559 [Epithele typhae]KAH9928481.1 hypothetical protein BXZ73DRAFT_90559 [Epithele typhae]